jgi:hypothetical protein
MHRYITEREFVYNTRRLDDGARVVQAIRQSEGKHLTHTARRVAESVRGIAIPAAESLVSPFYRHKVG